MCWSAENVELILKSISNQHSSEGQDNDQPDYDSVASDEDTDLETNAAKSNRQKVRLNCQVLFMKVICINYQEINI